MKQVFGVLLTLIATPALAHNEVIVATSVMPLATAIAGISMAALLAWRRGRRK
ncbi:hypothetical protein [Pseudooctadecabacter sp.]|uniref:hypothetical protein n=1 Tax=Pseudooctadecabacter sp. TaxID=1966338 RepID=UPI0035C86DA6